MGIGAIFIFIPGCESDFKFTGCENGIVVKHLVKIAQAEKYEFSGETLFDLMVLLHHGSEVFHSILLSKLKDGVSVPNSNLKVFVDSGMLYYDVCYNTGLFLLNRYPSPIKSVSELDAYTCERRRRSI